MRPAGVPASQCAGRSKAVAARIQGRSLTRAAHRQDRHWASPECSKLPGDRQPETSSFSILSEHEQKECWRRESCDRLCACFDDDRL
jgi:hypothetical protein